MPMLTDTGGNAGSQTCVLIIRGMAVGDIQISDIWKVVWKELRVSLICAFTLAAANFVRIILMYPGEYMIAGIVCVSLMITVILAKLIGGTLPIVAKAAKLDPAIMASPIITTIVDAVALFVYFSISSKLLLGL